MGFQVLLFVDDSVSSLITGVYDSSSEVFFTRSVSSIEPPSKKLLVVHVNLGYLWKKAGTPGHSSMILTVLRLLPAAWEGVELTVVRDINTLFSDKEDSEMQEVVRHLDTNSSVLLRTMWPQGYQRQRPCMAMGTVLRHNPLLGRLIRNCLVMEANVGLGSYLCHSLLSDTDFGRRVCQVNMTALSMLKADCKEREREIVGYEKELKEKNLEMTPKLSSIHRREVSFCQEVTKLPIFSIHSLLALLRPKGQEQLFPSGEYGCDEVVLGIYQSLLPSGAVVREDSVSMHDISTLEQKDCESDVKQPSMTQGSLSKARDVQATKRAKKSSFKQRRVLQLQRGRGR